MFNMKRLMLLGLMALVLSTSLVLTTGVASAKTTSLTRAAAGKLFCGGTCDGKNPSSEGCIDNVGDFYSNWQWASQPIGPYQGIAETIVIRYSYSCHAAWAKVTFTHPLPSGWHGNAIITRTSDNRQYDCTTGNDIVYPNQISCYSGMVDDGLGTSAWAAGMAEAGHGWWEVVRTTSAF